MLVTAELFKNCYRQNAEMYDADNFVSFCMGVERGFLLSEKNGRC
jgi:hypothetical protein